jgi:hypothetical protein
MKQWKLTAVIMIIFVLVASSTITAGQEPFRVSEQQVAQLLTHLDTHMENFRQSFATAIDRSFLKDAAMGQYIKLFAREMEQLTDRLKDHSHDRKPISSEVQEVLNRGHYLDTFMKSYDLGSQAENDWQLISADLQQLASYYKIKTYWGMPTSIGSRPRADLGTLSNRLIGTYELQKSPSDNVRNAVEQIVNNLPQESRRRVMSALVIRMRAPERLAIARQQDKVTLASSLQTARVYTATGHAFTGQGERESVLLYGNQFRLTNIAEADSIYSVTYATIEEGAGLHVTRTALMRQFSRPLVIVSYYKKISDTPQLNLDVEAPTSESQSDTRKKPR